MRARWLANPHQGHIHFPHKFRSSCEYILIIIKVKILCSLNGHIGPPPPIILTTKRRIVVVFSTCNQTSFKHVFLVSVLGVTSNHIPLKHR
jgi:hypothetical protein